MGLNLLLSSQRQMMQFLERPRPESTTWIESLTPRSLQSSKTSTNADASGMNLSHRSPLHPLPSYPPPPPTPLLHPLPPHPLPPPLLYPPPLHPSPLHPPPPVPIGHIQPSAPPSSLDANSLFDDDDDHFDLISRLDRLSSSSSVSADAADEGDAKTAPQNLPSTSDSFPAPLQLPPTTARTRTSALASKNAGKFSRGGSSKHKRFSKEKHRTS